jgi:hypothetical protein
MRDIVETYAAEQLGLISRRQLNAARVSEAAIRHQVATGRWKRVRSGVFVVNGAPSSWEQSVLGAILGAGTAWASHATSARLSGFDRVPGPEIELMVVLERRPRVDGVRVHRSGTLEDADLGMVGVIPTLSVARTVADLSGRLDTKELGRMVDDGLRRGVLHLGALDRVTRRLTRIAPGRSPQRLAQILADRVPGYHASGSELENRVFAAIVDAGLPAPVRQHKVVVGPNTYYVDLAYPEPLIAIEVDGFAVHSGRSAFDSDRRRQNDLARAGWIVVRFTSTSSAEEIVRVVHELLFGRNPSS